MPALLFALAALLALSAPDADSYRPELPRERALTVNGPAGRYLLDGQWLVRRDARDGGMRARWFDAVAVDGWRSVEVPNAWNAGDNSVRSMLGEPVWYRKDFVLPEARLVHAWIARFESAGYRATVWLNGRMIGEHIGNYVPFELPLADVRAGVNRLVVRTDNRLHATDFPPLNFSAPGHPLGGWWNYGGITRDVYLRRVDRVDLADVQMSPRLACPRCDAVVAVSATLRNYSSSDAHISVAGSYGAVPIDLGEAALAPGATVRLSGSVVLRAPRLWSPPDPFLYPARLEARIAGRPVASYDLLSGVRSIAVGAGGRLLLNGRPLDFRGVALHEDSPRRGSAITNAERSRLLAWARELGATEIRSHYPLGEYAYEQADRLGLLAWAEIPVYRMFPDTLSKPAVRAAALAYLREAIAASANHPSVFTWSLGNELNQTTPAGERAYVAAAARTARTLDPTRPTALALGAVPHAACGGAYAPVQLIGINDYYGWYGGSLRERGKLSRYLDAVRACQPRKAIVISEFGAEASRRGPATQHGTYAYQRAFVRFHLGLYATKRWLSGATYFALHEFRVRPDWTGGNPRPRPPWHQKGLVSRTGARKPAFADVERSYRATAQYPAR